MNVWILMGLSVVIGLVSGAAVYLWEIWWPYAALLPGIFFAPYVYAATPYRARWSALCAVIVWAIISAVIYTHALSVFASH
jgi:hypothetical protein